jgi:hypothetical protein
MFRGLSLRSWCGVHFFQVEQKSFKFAQQKLLETGLEPATFCSEDRCSAIEPPEPMLPDEKDTRDGTRTRNLLFRRQMLYH